MAANGQLVFTDVDKVTFKGVGNTSNAVIDTITGKLGVGVDSPDANLHIIGNCFVSTNLDLGGDLTTSNIVTGGTLGMGGHILPTANEQYDIGSASYKVRHLFLSDNSLWLGDESKLSFTGNQLKFRRRKKGVTPASILALDGASEAEALSVRGKGLVTEMKIEDWLAYARTKDPSMDISNIFRDDDADYETTSASEAFKEVGDGIYSTNNVSIGKTTAPTSALDVNGTVTATAFVGTLDAAKITTGTLDRNTTGSAATLTTPRSIGGVNFDGSAAIVPTTFGAATFDTDTLVVDSTNNRVGIGKTNPTSPLDVVGTVMATAFKGGRPTFLAWDYLGQRSTNFSAAGSSITQVAILDHTFDIPSCYHHLGTANLKAYVKIDWRGESDRSWNFGFRIELSGKTGAGADFVAQSSQSDNSSALGNKINGLPCISYHESNFDSTPTAASVTSMFSLPNCDVSSGSTLKVNLVGKYGDSVSTVLWTGRTKGFSNALSHELPTSSFFVVLDVEDGY